ncbi:MAG: sulfotransferase [Woeseia sp.]
MMPTFLGIGAQKCASTWLHRIVASHPAVHVPDIKEANFFSYHFDHGYQWYERMFNPGSSVTQIGEVSPSYFHDPAVPARVYQYRPDIKILLTLRDPIQRALSNHRHEVRAGHIVGDDLSFEKGLANNPMYVEQGLYSKHLANWLEYFPRDRILIILVDDIENDPGKVAREVYQFLGIDPKFQPTGLAAKPNRSVTSRSEGLLRRKQRIYELTRKPGLAWLWKAASGLGFRKLYRRINVTDSEVSMLAGTEKALRKQYKEDLNQLEQTLGRSLVNWQAEGSKNKTGVRRRGRTSEGESWSMP